MEDLDWYTVVVMAMPLALLADPFVGKGRARYEWLLVYVVIIPLFTVPAHWWLLAHVPRDLVPSSDLAWSDTYRVSVAWALLTLLPGVANLGPFLWLHNAPDRRMRVAALLGGFAGAVRFLVPVVWVLAQGTAVEYTDLVPALPVGLVSLGLWVVTVLVIPIAALLGVFISPEGRGSLPARVEHSGDSPPAQEAAEPEPQTMNVSR